MHPLPQSMQNDKNEIVSGNDYMQDFLDAKIEYKEDAMVSKQDILNADTEMYPSHKRSMQQMISAMKE